MNADSAISVVVPFFNSARFIERCIESLLNQSYEGEYEIILVNNDSKDESRALASRYEPQIVLLDQSTPGAYAARNTGIKQAKHPLIAFTDADCEVGANWLSAIHDAMTDKGVSMVLGQCLYPPESSGFLRWVSKWENAKTEYVLDHCGRQHHYGYTNNMAVRSEVFAKTGLFLEWQRAADSELVHRWFAAYPDQHIKYVDDMRMTHLEFVSGRQRLTRLSLYTTTNAKIDTFQELNLRQRLGVIAHYLRH